MIVGGARETIGSPERPDTLPRFVHAVGGLCIAAWATRYVDCVRIWDLDTTVLCDQHLLGGHRELHAIWSILTTGKRGYAHHPETLRWRGRLAALYARHDAEVREMALRGFHHRSPLDSELAAGIKEQTDLLDSREAQRARLAARPCECPLG
jgi:hypothetical protein